MEGGGLTYEFCCEDGHLSEIRFKSLGAAIAHFEDPRTFDGYTMASCRHEGCGLRANRVYGNAGTVFYGQGWDNPAPSGRTHTTGADPHKALLSMGKGSMLPRN